MGSFKDDRAQARFFLNEGMSMLLDFEAMFDRFNRETERKWSHDRTQTLGASETFGCLRKAWFAKRGIDPDPSYTQSTGYAKRGSIMENHYIVPVLSHEGNLPEGTELLFAGADQESLIDGRLSATPDGLIKGLDRGALAKYGVPDIESDCILCEIKTFDPQANLKGPKDQHVGQVNQQFGLIRLLTEHRPVWAVILYVNSSDYSDIRPFPVRYSESIFEAARTRANTVYTANDPGSILPEGKIKGGSDCQYCAWQDSCKAATVASIPNNRKPGTFSPQDEAELEELISKQVEAGKLSDEFEKKKKQVNEEIKSWLSRHSTGFAKTSNKYSASWQKVSGRKSYDIDAMAEDGVDISKYEQEGEPGDRLVVKAG